MSKILLVEDDYHLGLILKDQLEMNEYEVTLIRLPKTTIANLQKEKFDLIILDKLLKEIDGTELCAEIRNTEGISKTPILMMSGLDGSEDICLAAGANNFIPKPFEVDSFLNSIRTTIDMAKAPN